MSRPFVSCAAVGAHLGAFADGELRGDLLRRVSKHVEACPGCAASVVETGQLGEALRIGATLSMDAPDLSGLADGVVSRVLAEEHESWRGKFERATDDLHWIVAGVGSVAAAFVSALVVSLVVQSGVEQRGDSLAAMLNTLASPPPSLRHAAVLPAGLSMLGVDELQMASLAEINDDGHVLSLQPLSAANKKNAAVLIELRRMRFAQQQDRRMTDPDARRFVWLFSATEVRGKIL